MSDRNDNFMPQRGNGYKKLLAFQKAECIYDTTVIFCSRYISTKSRTYDQMVQAARSGKQNIAEGYVDGATSKKTELNLTTVAKGSLQELLLDYEDYLRIADVQRDLNRSSENLLIYDGDKADKMKHACRKHNDSAYYRNACEHGNDEQIANMAITLLHQEDVMLTGYIEKLKQKFLTEGGISEEMYRARKKFLAELEEKENKWMDNARQRHGR